MVLVSYFSSSSGQGVIFPRSTIHACFASRAMGVSYRESE